MSKLQAPGFSSRLKQPKSVTQPVPSSDGGVFKRPQSLAIPQTSQHSNANSTFQKTSTNGYGQKKLQSPTVAPTQHGPSPYERSKPPTSQIPYVGKKRTIGVLKAPVARTNFNQSDSMKPSQKLDNMNESVKPKENKVSNNNNVSMSGRPIKKPNSASNSAGIFKKPAAIVKDKDNDVSQVKPVRRKLIPETTSKPAAIPRPRSSTDLSRPPSGISKPRALGRNTSKTSSSGIAGGRTLSKSLQSLSQPAKCVNSKNTPSKSVSQSDLRKPSLAASNQSGLHDPKKKTASKFGFAPKQSRQRASSNKLDTSSVVSISTPCQPGNKHRDKIKISPIAIEGEKSNSVEVSHFSEMNAEASATFQLVNEKTSIEGVEQLNHDDPDGAISSPEFDEPSNTFEQTELLGKTNLDINALCKNNVNESIFFTGPKTVNPILNSTKTFSQPHSLNSTFQKKPCNAEENELNSTYQKDNKENNTTFNANQTFDVNQNPNATFAVDESLATFAVDESLAESKDVNATHIIQDENKKELEVMDASYGHSGTPQALDIELQKSLNKPKSDNSKTLDVNLCHESDFIENAIMPNLATPFRNDTSFLSEQTQNNESFTVDVNKVIDAITSASSVNRTTHTTAYSPMKVNNFVRSASICSGEERSSAYTSMHLDVQSPPRSVSVTDEPATPSQDDNDFDIGARSYTISMGALGRREAGYSRLRRHYTLGSQELSKKFRIPRQMNTVETLEGNIMMDNTTFLQFSNDVKAMKTQLLKLKRTLLEADCVSPLVKEAGNRQPVSPRTAEVATIPPLQQRQSHSSPLAVVDPLVNENAATQVKPKEKICEDTVSLTSKFTQALRCIEELEKTSECDKYTIKLLQTQLENSEQKELDILEENIILREQNGILNEKLHALQVNGSSSKRERTASTGSSYEDFDVGVSRKNILQRLYSNEAYNSE